MSFNDDDKDKNVVSSFYFSRCNNDLRAREGAKRNVTRNNEAIYIKLTYRLRLPLDLIKVP